MTMITQRDFEEEMEKIKEEKSPIIKHIKADELMCDVLKQFGYDAGVKVFEGMEKHY